MITLNSWRLLMAKFDFVLCFFFLFLCAFSVVSIFHLTILLMCTS
jgi:hypothetical protein